MNSHLVRAFFGALIISTTMAFGQVTENPKVEEQSQPHVKIKRVELTDSYTIIHLQFVDKQLPNGIPRQPGQGFPFPLNPRQQAISGSQIWLDPETRLYKPGEIEQKYKLIRAENIPTSGKKEVTLGETVDFVAYFERLAPGTEIFDFYEGRSANGYQSWNFYGVHIKNPLKKQKDVAAKPGTKKPVTKPKPAEQTAGIPFDNTPKEESVKEEPAGGNVAGQLRGTIYDAKTRKPIPAELSYLDHGDSIQLKSSSGKYKVTVDRDGSYEFTVNAKGYVGGNFTLTPGDSADRAAFDRDIYLNPLAVGATIALPNIYFETSQYTLLSESSAELNKLVTMMKENPGMQISIEGHTDNVGDFDKNLDLSRRRAEAVKEYLIGKGVDPARLEAKGYGATRPLYSGADRNKNRRVEFVVIQM